MCFLCGGTAADVFFFFFISLHQEAMISWGEFQAAMPWKVVLLVGGGFALAEGTKVSCEFLMNSREISFESMTVSEGGVSCSGFQRIIQRFEFVHLLLSVRAEGRPRQQRPRQREIQR